MVISLPFTNNPPVVCLADARKVPVSDSSIDLVFTSPPYINVFNYHQQYRMSTEALGWDVLPIARSEIGSNRKFRGNRFFTVAQYCLDMTSCLREIHRVLRRNGRAIFVVGRESNVRKTAFYNGAIIGMLAERIARMSIVLRQERVFQNRFGDNIFEDILHFKLNRQIVGDIGVPAAAREIAIEVLSDARTRVPAPDIRDELEEAIAKAPSVDPSPFLDLVGQPRFTTLLPTVNVNTDSTSS